jgi:hypothetical protein
VPLTHWTIDGRCDFYLAEKVIIIIIHGNYCAWGSCGTRILLRLVRGNGASTVLTLIGSSRGSLFLLVAILRGLAGSIARLHFLRGRLNNFNDRAFGYCLRFGTISLGLSAFERLQSARSPTLNLFFKFLLNSLFGGHREILVGLKSSYA